MSTILIVEDHALSRQALTALLGYFGHRLLEAPDGAVGLELARSEHPDLVITDIVMPSMDGIEFVRRMRRENGAYTPVIFYTATYRLSDARRMVEGIGGCRVIPKPSEPLFILKSVHEMLGIAPADAPSLPIAGNPLDLLTYSGFRYDGVRHATLMDFSICLLRERDRDRIPDIFCTAALRLMNCSYIQFALIKEDETFSIKIDDKRKGESRIFPVSDKEILERVVYKKRVLRLENPSPSFSSAMVVPLATLNRAYGWFCLADKCDLSPFNDQDEETAVVLGDKAALVYENVLLMEDMKQQVELEIKKRAKAEEEKRQVEEQLRQSQKMEAIGQLAGGIAHDFNNRLAAILNNAFLMKFQIREDDPMLRHIDAIIHSAENSAALTRNLLAFSRKQVMSVKYVDMNDVVKRSCEFMRRVIGEDIELKVVLYVGTLTVQADVMQIENALMNLAVNARDAMPEGGVLSVATEEVDLDEQASELCGAEMPGRYAVITVSDTGAGMDEEVRLKIFEPFFTTKELGKGTGLGLASVYGTMKQHGGAVTVHSEQGRGTTFRLYVPMTAAAAPESITAPAAPEGGVGTILLVEDDAEVREATKGLLSEFGYKVIAAGGGMDALEKFREHTDVDLLLIDVVMPDINGKEVYEAALKLNPSIKALFMSGYPADVIGKRGLLDGGLNYLAKPATPEELLSTIKEIVGKSKE